MAPYGFSLTKQFMWRGKLERFSNIYHYVIDGATTEGFGWDAFLADLQAQEAKMFSDAITYVEGRAWGPTYEANDATPANKAASITQYIGDLTGNGVVAAAAGPNIYRETSIVASWYVGRSALTGRKRFLRKYFHVGRLYASEPEGVTLGADPMADLTQQYYFDWAEGFKTLTSGLVNYDICTPGGDKLPAGTDTKILPHLHIRQLKQ